LRWRCRRASRRQPRPRRLRHALNTVAVDFVAVSIDGQPIADLKPEEVQVRVDGRQRPIKWLEWIPVAATPGDEGSTKPVPLLPPPFGSNGIADAGRSFVIAIEDDSFRHWPRAPPRRRRSVSRGVISARPRRRRHDAMRGWKTGLTTDHAKVRAELSKIGGREQ
jgi:hypothetical protein